MNDHKRTTLQMFWALVLTSVIASGLAQEVSIPDPGLNAAIRQELGLPIGPLSMSEMLSLTNLNASRRDVSSIAGLETACNLVSLDLQINQLTNFALPSQLTNLSTIDLSANPLTNFSLPDGLRRLTSLTIEGAELTSLTLPADLSSLVTLDLGFNAFTQFSLPGGLTNLSSFYFAGNPLTNVSLSPGLAGMTELNLSQNVLASFTLPAGMTNLIELDLSFNQLTNVTFPGDVTSLASLDLDFNRLTTLSFPSNLASLRFLHLRANEFTNFSLPTVLSRLVYLDVSLEPLRSIILPVGMSNLTSLRISENTNLTSLVLPVGMTNLTGLITTANQLTNLVLPPDLGRLESINLGGNQLTSLRLPSGMTSLVGLFVTGNQLTNITLPPDLTQVVEFGYLGNPLTTVVLSELNATNLATDFAFLQNQGVSVFTYPLTVQLLRPRTLVGAFQFGITGPPGVYSILGSTDLASWSVLGAASNSLGSINFADVTTQLSQRTFYRALLQSPPSNMVFIPAGTFTMGTPVTEVNRQPDEGPQTTVKVSRGFWMGKYEVTQREYLAVIGSNPSGFPGDLDRPVEGVSWLDATNYCARLTQQELAAGRIPPGSRYRLPTEAEWEYAARGGTSTRFSYGDDPNFTSLTNYAWYWANSANMTHRVGQKTPNPLGLHDMQGNVWEWCQDWYGPYPGGSVTDPQGPASNSQGVKVIRGGAWDAGEADCRSGRRLTKGVSPFITDFILGFRVVLVTEPQ